MPTTVSPTSVITNAGIDHVTIYRIDQNFVPKGMSNTPDVIVDGTTLNALHINRADNLTMGQPTRVVATTRGGGTPGPTFQMGINDLGQPTITFAMKDIQLESSIEGVTPDSTTHSDLLIAGHNPGLQFFGSYGVIIHSQVKGDGVGQNWVNKCYLNCTITTTQYMAAGQAGGENTQMMIITLTPSQSTKTPAGELISSLTSEYENDTTDYLDYYSDDPMYVSTYVAAVSDTGWTLPFKPTSSEVLNSENITTKDGVVENATSITTATAAIVTPVMASQETWVFFGPTQFKTV